MTNWKTLAEKENAKTYVLPEGWDSRDTVAAQLDCSPEKVDDHLRPALKSGKVVKQQHRVWDAGLKRVITVTAYHDTSLDSATVDNGAALDKIRALKASGLSWPKVGESLGMSGARARAIARRADGKMS